LILAAPDSRCCSAALTHIALASKRYAFAYYGSGNVVGRRPLAAIQIAQELGYRIARGSARRAMILVLGLFILEMQNEVYENYINSYTYFFIV
jgi:hypothetical protein